MILDLLQKSTNYLAIGSVLAAEDGDKSTYARGLFSNYMNQFEPGSVVPRRRDPAPGDFS